MYKAAIQLTVVALAGALLAGCAGSGKRAPPLEPPRCLASETLVCYGKTASKLDSRLEEADFCRCEQRVDLL